MNHNYTSDLQYDPNEDEYEPCSKKLLPSLFAWFLLIGTTSSYFTLVFPLFYDLIGSNRFHLFILAACAHAIVFLYVLINFSIATFMDPGRFPKVDIADNGEGVSKPLSSTNYKNVLINDINVRMKWCTTCQFYRPPRSSHCAVCNTCIDTMDHHCPWVSNCIGRRNYKYFFSFLVSLTLHMLVILSLCLTLVLLNKDNLANIPMLAAIVLIILISILIIPIGGLTGFHIILVSRGRTTNEQVTGKFRTGVNPFDEGLFTNCAKILFSSTPPSYMKFRRKQIHLREYYQTKLLLQRYSIKSKNEKVAKNGQLVKGGDALAHNYKNPNFHANNNNNNNKRVRKHHNHHQQNELELKFHNHLNRDEMSGNFNHKNDEFIRRSNQLKKNLPNNYDNQIDYGHVQQQKKKNGVDLKYARNNSYTHAANQMVENIHLIPDDHKCSNGFGLSVAREHAAKATNKKRHFTDKKQFRENSNFVDQDDRPDYNSYEITV